MGNPPNFLREIQKSGDGTREWLIHRFIEPALPLRQVHAVGWVDARYGFNNVRPVVKNAILFCCYEGEGEVWCHGEWRRCGAGNAYLAPIGKPCAYRALPGQEWRCCWLVGMDDSIISGPEPTLVPADPARLLAAIQAIHDESILSADVSVVQSWLDLIVAYSWRIAHPQARHGSRLRPLWSLVLADLAHDWTLAELADRAGLSGETLRRLCHAETGHSPVEYVTRLRMRYAASLLMGGPLSIESVAARVGYNNPFAFSTAFKRATGRSPREYRNEKRLPQPGSA